MTPSRLRPTIKFETAEHFVSGMKDVFGMRLLNGYMTPDEFAAISEIYGILSESVAFHKAKDYVKANPNSLG